MAAPVFRTLAADARPVGVARVGEVWLTVLPLVDRTSGLFARLSWASAKARAVALGGRLPSPADLDAGLAAGLLLHPVTLPTPEMIPRGMTDQEAREALMMGREWCTVHDNRVRRQLADLGLDGRQHVASAGKHWVEGSDARGAYPPPGWAALYGWFRSRRPGDVWQSLNDGRPKPLRHDAGTGDDSTGYTDYGTLSHVAWDHDPGPLEDVVALAEVAGQIERV